DQLLEGLEGGRRGGNGELRRRARARGRERGRHLSERRGARGGGCRQRGRRRTRQAVRRGRGHGAARRQRLHVGDDRGRGGELRARERGELAFLRRLVRAPLHFRDQRVVAAGEREVGAAHLACLEVDDAAAAVAEVARTGRHELAARRQRGAVRLHDVRAVVEA